MYWKTKINTNLQMRYKIIWDILQKCCSDGEACWEWYGAIFLMWKEITNSSDPQENLQG